MQRLVVVAAVIERGGRVLVSQRGPASGQPGRWEFPGGKREQGESDRKALRRELVEELGIELDVGPRVWTAHAGPLELRFYRCRWVPGLRPRPLSSVQFRWVLTTDLPTYSFPPADAGLVAALAAGRLTRHRGHPQGRGTIQGRSTEAPMAKAKRERRASIRNMQGGDDALRALEQIERQETAEREASQESAPRASDSNGDSTSSDEA
jgi:8-oxo-dGTP diphosphatase